MSVVLYGVASQTLSHTAPEVIASATYEILDLTKAQADSDRVLASGSATVPSFSLTLDAAAGPGEADASLIPVTLTAGPSIGDTVVITGSDGTFEAVTVGAIETNDYLSATSLLASAFAIGATVAGVTITAAVPVALYNFEAALDDGRPLAIAWTYTTAAGPTVKSQPITLSRGSDLLSVGEALDDIRMGWPDLEQRLPDKLTLRALADYSVRRIRVDFLIRSVDPTQLLLGETGTLLLVAKMLAEAAVRGYSPGMMPVDSFAASTADDYGVHLERLTTGTAGADATYLDTEHVSDTRADQKYLSPISAA